MNDQLTDKRHTLKATASVLDYLCRDLERHECDGLVHALHGARCYCVDLLQDLADNAESQDTMDYAQHRPRIHLVKSGIVANGDHEVES